MIYDCFTYNGEADLWDIRYNILKNYVDRFIVVEFDKTFSGKPKVFLFPREIVTGNPKVYYYPTFEKDYEKYRTLAESSPQTAGAEHWKREFMQKESIRDTLTNLEDNDIVFVGDCDEIWEYPDFEIKHPAKLNLRVYTYWLNNRSSEQFCGTIVSRYKHLKGECLNHVRSGAWRTDKYYGWHFTSMGGSDAVKRKLTDSYTEESYATKAVLDNLSTNIENNKDFLGRDFQYTVDESEWPQYLKDNRERYQYLLK